MSPLASARTKRIRIDVLANAMAWTFLGWAPAGCAQAIQAASEAVLDQNHIYQTSTHNDPNEIDGGTSSSGGAAAGANGGVAAQRGCLIHGRQGLWVQCVNGNLTYTSTKTLDHVQDYAQTGYKGGGVTLPSLVSRVKVSPSGGDDSQAIQNAINQVQMLPVDANGLRGKVVLSPGTFLVGNTLAITANGVALEGSGTYGASATVLKGTGAPHAFVSIFGKAAQPSGSPVAVPAGYVPAGAYALKVASTNGITVGSAIQLSVTRNLAWIKSIWAPSAYPPEDNGQTESAWGSSMTTNVTKFVTAINDGLLTFDAQLGDAIPQSSFASATVQLLDVSGLLHNVGVAHLIVQGQFIAGSIDVALWSGITVNNAMDAWVDDIVVNDCGALAVGLNQGALRTTVQDVRSVRTGTQTGSAKPGDFLMSGTQNLMQGLMATGNQTFYVLTPDNKSVGPNALHHFIGVGGGAIEPHQRWATALLVDNAYLQNGAIAFTSRGTFGSGQGWSMGFGVVYNSVAGTGGIAAVNMDMPIGIAVDQPPGAANWGAGLIGPATSRDKTGLTSTNVEHGQTACGMASLWLEQVRLKKGPEGLNAVTGPWLLTDLSGTDCLTAQSKTLGATVTMGACDPAHGSMMWDFTTRGLVRLVATDLCLDASASNMGQGIVHLAACSENPTQLFTILERTGAQTTLTTSDAQGCFGLALVADAITRQSCQTLVPSFRVSPATLTSFSP